MYYFEEQLPKINSKAQLRKRGKVFLETSDLQSLASLLHVERHRLKLIAAYPDYDSFFVHKPSGGKRLIEEPVKQLKRIQGKLANYFQGVYYPMMTRAAYGFIPVPGDEESPRNIYTNACQHLGQQWVLNVDLRDFFHAVTQGMVYQTFLQAPFDLSEEAAATLAAICCLHGRLPMGAPSSPVLSNIVLIKTDKLLLELSEQEGWKYTRYADDLCFSGPKKFGEAELGKITAILRQQGFKINKNKTRISDIKDPPEVTGLLLKKQPDVTPAFVQGIKADIQLYHLLTADRVSQRRIFRGKEIKKLMRSILGQINFLEFVRGEYHPSCIDLNLAFDPDKRKRGQGEWTF